MYRYIFISHLKHLKISFILFTTCTYNYIYCNIDNSTYDMHLFYTYLFLSHDEFAKIITLGSLVSLLFPISIESIVI